MTKIATIEPAEQRVVLYDVRWETYQALLADPQRSGGRLSYADGLLEIMTTSLEHEELKCLLGMLIEAYAVEMDIDFLPSGSLTLKRKDVGQGTEPDESYYIANAALVRGRKRLRLPQDPPPDLVVEIEITRSAIDRLELHAKLGTPEVWRHNGKKLSVHVLGEDGAYRPSRRSLAFPRLPLPELARFLERRRSRTGPRIVKSFRSWVRRSRAE